MFTQANDSIYIKPGVYVCTVYIPQKMPRNRNSAPQLLYSPPLPPLVIPCPGPFQAPTNPGTREEGSTYTKRARCGRLRGLREPESRPIMICTADRLNPSPTIIVRHCLRAFQTTGRNNIVSDWSAAAVNGSANGNANANGNSNANGNANANDNANGNGNTNGNDNGNDNGNGNTNCSGNGNANGDGNRNGSTTTTLTPTATVKVTPTVTPKAVSTYQR